MQSSKNNRTVQLIATLTGIASLVPAGTALAHGPQIQVSLDPATGQIVTRSIVDTHSALPSYSDAKRVYVMPLTTDNISGVGSTYQARPFDDYNTGTGAYSFAGPGIVYQYESALAGSGWAYDGSSTLPNLKGSHFYYSLGTALQYATDDGLGNWSLSSTPGGEQIQAYRTAAGNPLYEVGNSAAVSGRPGAVLDQTRVGQNASTGVYALSANPHQTASFKLGVDDGTTFNPAAATADGVYVLTMTLDNDLSSVGASDPFYFVLYKGVPQSQALAAASAIDSDPLTAGVQSFAPALIQAVPEPTGVSACLVAGAAAALRRRRRAGFAG